MLLIKLLFFTRRKINLEQKVDIPDEPCSVNAVTSQSIKSDIDTECLNNDEVIHKASGPSLLDAGLLIQDHKNPPFPRPIKKVLKIKTICSGHNSILIIH